MKGRNALMVKKMNAIDSIKAIEALRRTAMTSARDTENRQENGMSLGSTERVFKSRGVTHLDKAIGAAHRPF